MFRESRDQNRSNSTELNKCDHQIEAWKASGVLQDLVRRIGEGDVEALGSLYSKTVRGLFGKALRIAGSREPAGGIVQDVFVQVWASADTSRSLRSHPLAWTCAVTHRGAVDVARRRRVGVRRDHPLKKGPLLPRITLG